MTSAIIVLATAFGAAFTSGQTDVQQQQWVTKTLYEVLENYVPDGGSTCNSDGQTYRQGLKDLKLWATQMYDASAKFPTGILSGKSTDFGDFDECLETNTTGLDFKSQYCLLNIRFSPFHEIYPNYYDFQSPKLGSLVPVWESVKQQLNPTKIQRNEINTAICIPSSCTNSDMQSTLFPKIVTAFNDQKVHAAIDVDSLHCTKQDDNPPITLGFIIFWCFILILVMLVILGTLYDLYSKKDTKLKFEFIFVAFSFPSNMKKLLNSGTRNTEYSGIHFLKITACLSILFGHRLMYVCGHPLYNPIRVEKTFSNILNGILHNGPLVVDIFFTISGFLTFILVYSELVKSNRFNMPLMVIWRWCRLLPVYGVLIAFHSFVLLHLSDGPMWKQIAGRESDNCLTNWWTNVLFVNNYVNEEQPCMIQSWYLASDMHLYIVGIIIVYLTWKHQKFGKLTMLTAIILPCLFSAYVIYEHKFYPTFMPFISNLKYPPSVKTFTLLYVPTHTRATPYFVGMFAAYTYQKMKIDKPEYRFPRPKLCLSTLYLAGMVWMTSISYFFMHEYNLWISVMYAITFRLIYSIIVSMFILISTVNASFKGSLLHVLAPLSRLTYGAYLGGLTMQIYHVASARTTTHMHFFLLTWITFGDWVYAFVIAFFLYLLIECPFENLLKQLVDKTKRGKHENQERTTKEIEILPRYTIRNNNELK